MVAQGIERDRVEPGLLARLAAVESAPSPERTLEGVREQVLGQGSVSRPVDEEPEERLRMLFVE